MRGSGACRVLRMSGMSGMSGEEQRQRMQERGSGEKQERMRMDEE